MADSIQVKLPAEMGQMLDTIRLSRSKNFEPKSNKSIVTDAVKEMYAKVTKA